MSPPPRGTSGSSPTSASCAPGRHDDRLSASKAEDVAWILGDSECRFVFAEDDEQIAKIEAPPGELPALDKSSPSKAPLTATG